MQEALTLFDSICNSKWFVKTSIILFLNKIDIFKEKVLISPLDKYFPEFTGKNKNKNNSSSAASCTENKLFSPGGKDYEKAAEFLTQKFVNLNQSDVKQVYPHLTCATDTSQVKFVMAAVNDIIIQNNLRDCGLL